jgi:hypothetical protein
MTRRAADPVHIAARYRGVNKSATGFYALQARPPAITQRVLRPRTASASSLFRGSGSEPNSRDLLQTEGSPRPSSPCHATTLRTLGSRLREGGLGDIPARVAVASRRRARASRYIGVEGRLVGMHSFGVDGAIETPEIRKVTTNTLDDGREAFDLRNRKYNFETIAG